MLDNKMTVELDPHVQKVAEFMKENIDQSKLVAVAKGLAAVAPVMWGRYSTEELPDNVVRLHYPPIN